MPSIGAILVLFCCMLFV